MRPLTRDQFLKILGMTSGAFDAQQRAGHVALAFGTPIPATAGRYFDLDLVGMAIALGLAPTVGRPTATTIVLGFLTNGSLPSATRMPIRRETTFLQWVLLVGMTTKTSARVLRDERHHRANYVGSARR